MPEVRYFSGGGGPVLALTLGVGRERLYMPAITDVELWGDTGGSAGRAPTGGNGVNHPSSLGASAIYGLHFAVQDYPLPRRAAYGLDEIIMARVDGTESIAAYSTVEGERLRPSNAAGVIGSSNPTQLTGTTWECLGRAGGASDAGRATLWRRVR